MPAAATMRSTSRTIPSGGLFAPAAQAFLRRAGRARGALELGAVHAAADVGRAEVEALAGRVDADRVEVASAECLDAHDATLLGGQELLHERGVIEPQLQRAVLRGRAERSGAVEAPDPGPAPPDVRLHHDREREPVAGGDPH